MKLFFIFILKLLVSVGLKFLVHYFQIMKDLLSFTILATCSLDFIDLCVHIKTCELSHSEYKMILD